MGRLAGKVAFITGAARGQGRSHAIRLAQEGANVIAIDLCGQVESVGYAMSVPDDLEHTVKLVAEAGGKMLARQGDVRDIDAVRAVVEEGVAEFGGLDIVLANAGIMPCVGEQAFTYAAFSDSVDIMLKGVYNTIEPCLPILVDQDRGGSIVITSSAAGLKGNIRSTQGLNAGRLGYAAAKFGVVGIMKLYSNAYGGHNIRVNTVHPTGVNTPMVVNSAFEQYANDYPEVMQAMSNSLPVPMIQPVDVSNAIVWLCSEEARYVTGVTLPVDAGCTSR